MSMHQLVDQRGTWIGQIEKLTGGDQERAEAVYAAWEVHNDLLTVIEGLQSQNGEVVAEREKLAAKIAKGRPSQVDLVHSDLAR
jgi:hypothetical protein